MHYTQTLCKKLSAHERKALQAEVMADARSVAQVAGGILGYGAISAEEAAMLKTLEEAFRT
jgi:uncharacterized membrane protein (DUF2068 family)